MKFPRYMRENAHSQESSCRSFRPMQSYLPYKDRTGIEDFEIIKPISRGAFGRVFLARKKATGDTFAIKVNRFLSNSISSASSVQCGYGIMLCVLLGASKGRYDKEKCG